MRSLIERDQKVIWHPYTQHGLKAEPLSVVSAQGSYLNLEDGRKILDSISSWWLNIHGHGNSRLQSAIARQVTTLDHVMFAGLTHEPAVELAEKLLELVRNAKADLTRLFYSDNGSTAVEVALKIAYQYHLNQGRKNRNRFLALKNSYHGDTLGAMALSDPDGFHSRFKPLLAAVDFIEPDDFSALEKAFAHQNSEYAGFVFEPLIQGAAGMKTYSAEFLRRAVDLSQEHQVVTIADEVFTGFYRTGTCFAFEQAGISPDIVCLSKGLTGGIVPLAATITSETIFEAFVDKEIRKAFLHGHSYTANPIACAAALESLKILSEDSCQLQIRNIAQKTRELTRVLAKHPHVLTTRSLGTIGAVELKNTGDYFSGSSSSVMKRAIAKGALLRPLGNVLYTVPPYCMTENELEKTYEIIGELIHEKF